MTAKPDQIKAAGAEALPADLQALVDDHYVPEPAPAVVTGYCSICGAAVSQGDGHNHPKPWAIVAGPPALPESEPEPVEAPKPNGRRSTHDRLVAVEAEHEALRAEHDACGRHLLALQVLVNALVDQVAELRADAGMETWRPDLTDLEEVRRAVETARAGKGA